MAIYTLLDPISGRVTGHDDRDFLSYLQHVNHILLRGEEHIGIITPRDLVVFARWCTGRIMSMHSNNHFPVCQRALALVDRWLDDPESTDKLQLTDAAWELRGERHLSWTLSRATESTLDAAVYAGTAGTDTPTGGAASYALSGAVSGVSMLASNSSIHSREQLERFVNIVRMG